jgi:hypothetical protein
VPGCGSGQGVDPDRASNVLDLLFAPVLKRDGQLVSHDFIDPPLMQMAPGSAICSNLAATFTPSP